MKNSGLKLEKELSKDFHQEGIPLLVSSALLRSRDMGQIDLARIGRYHGEWVIEVSEVKSSQMGFEQMERSQLSRLKGAQHFLASLFGHKTRLTRATKAVGIVLILQKFPTFINLVA